MASSPIPSWQIDEEKVEALTDVIFLDSKITADGDCSPKTQRHLLLRKKAMTNLDSILKSRDITLPTKVHIFKTMIDLDNMLKSRDITLLMKVGIVTYLVFPVVMYEYES